MCLLSAHRFPQEAVANFNGQTLTSFLELPPLSKLQSVNLCVKVFQKAIMPVIRDTEHGVDCVNLVANRGIELEIPDDDELGDVEHELPWNVLQVVHPTNTGAANEFGKLLAFGLISGTFEHIPRGQPRPITCSIPEIRLVVLRMFDGVEQTPENERDTTDTGCPMYRFRQPTSEHQYVMRDLNQIFSPSYFIPHPSDRTGTKSGHDGGTTKRRFFHLPECDLRCPIDGR